MNYELIIYWNPDTIIFSIGPLAVRWYSTCWLVGLLLAYFIVKYLFRQQKLPDEKFEPLFLYCFIGILVGARLGHCLFYEPGYFLTSWNHFIEMLLPIRQDVYGNWHFTGYEGLASHGGTIGIILALLLYSKNLKVGMWTILDIISISVPVTACFIRLGNLMNSEIIGKPTDVPWAFVFEKIDMLPRHPGQLYEAIAYACFFFVLWYFYKKKPSLVGTSFFFGLDIFLIFTFRFFIEYTKEVHESFEQVMLFDMSQLLSVPFILMGAYFSYKGLKKVKNK